MVARINIFNIPSLTIAMDTSVNWQPQPDMQQVTEPVPDTLTLERRNIHWDRPTVKRDTGILKAGNAHVITIVPRGKHFLETDPCARQVYALSNLGLTLPHGRRKRFWSKLLRGRMRHVNRRPEKLLGNTLLLGAYYDDCNNYYHYWADVMADLWFALQAGIKLSDIEHFLLPYSGVRWQQEILELCQVDLKKVIPLSAASHFQCQQLLLPLRAKGSYMSPVWLKSALQQLSRFPVIPNTGRRLYISRKDAKKRPLVNELEIINLLRQFDFQIIRCSHYSVLEQQQLFAEAEVIIAPHGAALTNLIWCSPHSRVLEFVPEGHHNPGFYDIAAICSLDYAVMQSLPVADGSDGVYLDTAPLLNYLQQHLA